MTEFAGEDIHLLDAHLSSWRFNIGYFNNLNVLTNTYLSPQQQSTSETIQALDILQSNPSENLKMITDAFCLLEQDLSSFVEVTSEKAGSEPQYFRSFLHTMTSSKHWETVRNLLISPLALTMAFSFSPLGEISGKDLKASTVERKEEQRTQNKGVSICSSSGSASSLYRKNYYEALPLFLQVNTLQETRELATTTDKDLAIFAELLKRYVTMVDLIVSYHPDSGDNHTLPIKKEDVLCQNVLNTMVTPIRHNLFLMRHLFAPRSNAANSINIEEPVEGEGTNTYFSILQFWCNILFVDLDTEAGFGYEERMKQVQKSGSPVISKVASNFIDELSGALGLKPNGKCVISVVGTENVFTGDILKDIPSMPPTHLPAYPDLLQMDITVFPIEVKKEIISSSYGVQLAHEKIENVTLDVKQGWSIEEIMEHTTLLKILQQGLRYLVGSSEVLFNHVIYLFPHYGVLHFVHLEVDLDALLFKDHPTDKNVKKVFLKSNKRKVHRENIEEEGYERKTSSSGISEVITERIVPVKIAAYPLETVSGKTTVPLLSGMVAIIVLVHKIILILKDPKKIIGVRIKMMALRRALQKGTDILSPEVSKNKKRLQRKSDDEELSEAEKRSHVSQDEKIHMDKKHRSSRDNQTSVEKTGKSPVKPTGESPEKADNSANQELDPRMTFVFEYLKLHLQTENEGPLDYVTNDITLYSNPEIHTTMRALTLEEKFGIKLLCPGPTFHKRHQLASVLLMPQHTFRESMIDPEDSSGPDFWKILIGRNPGIGKYDQLAFKYYSPEILYDAYRIAGDCYYDSDFNNFSSFRDYVYRCYYLNEWKYLKTIQKYNETAGQGRDYSKTIAIPKALFRGDHLTLELGRWGDYDDMGCFMVTEALTPESGGWKNTLPLQESVVEDACNQIEVMIKKIRIRHNDLKLSNLIFTKGRVHFIDFGLSIIVRKMKKDKLDEMVKEDQETIRGLLLSSY